MKKFTSAIPKDTECSRTLMTKKIEQQANHSQQYKVSYEIAYPKTWCNMMSVLMREQMR